MLTFVHRPQTNLLRKALFQIHLWTGVVVALYVVVIGVTGSALVFRPEMQKATIPQFFEIPRNGEPDASATVFIENLNRAYAGYQLVGIDYPTQRRATYLSYLTKDGDLKTVFSHPVSGEILGELPKASWITRLQDLHFDLLGGSTGRRANGIGACLLIAMFATGLVIWWPGVDRWRQSLWVDFRNGWRRVNWASHSAIGFWLFALLLLWGVTGVEFVFREPFRRIVNAISPLTVAKTPSSSPAGASKEAVNIETLIEKSRALVPGAKMGRIVLPSSSTSPILILVAYVTHGDFDKSDEVTLYFDQYTGELLERRADASQKLSSGDLFMKWIGPLHVGSFGGTGVKVLWSILALSFPALAITGLLMWWNRVLRAKIRAEKPV